MLCCVVLAAEHADYEKNMEYLQEKHAVKKGKQKAVPLNFEVSTLVCYAKEDDTPGYAFSVYIIMEKDVYDTVLAAARRMHL